MNYKIKRIEPFGVIVSPESINQCIKSIDIKSLRELFNQDQIVILRGFITFTKSSELEKYCELWGEISIWPFGKTLELVEHEDPKDHIFDNNYVPLHWDGMYRPQVPEYQIFHCVKAPIAGKGGRTTFSNTILALRKASLETRNFWSKVIGSYERKMEFYNSKVVSPIITKHPVKGFQVIRYNEPPREDEKTFLNPPNLKFTGVDKKDLALFHESLKKSLYDKENFYAHEWFDGDVVIADNLSLLHGREGFVSKSSRHLQRVQVLSHVSFENSGLESYK